MKSKVLNLILLLSFFRTISGETYAYFDHFTTKDGLISNRVTAIAQDSLGYIWMATDFGLERFDGKKFKHFQRKDYPKLFRNDFHGVDYYRNKVIISGNNGMLMEYDIERDDFLDRRFTSRLLDFIPCEEWEQFGFNLKEDAEVPTPKEWKIG